MQPATEAQLIEEIERHQRIVAQNADRMVKCTESDALEYRFEIKEIEERIERLEKWDQNVKTRLQNLGKALAVEQTRTFPFYHEVQSRQPAAAN